MRPRIEIEQVENGYMVSDDPDIEKVYVFNNIEHLCEWLQRYFDDQVEQAKGFDSKPNDWRHGQQWTEKEKESIKAGQINKLVGNRFLGDSD